ncbi:hypothetical protein IHE56_12710 [Streptomyces sp. ID01-12c]|uniref:Uncharacterized protein n=1 Tax=Streptomyces caniscabiei TaxID=2746961 RepID=A0A927QKH7_9ACTN|nr:hypothetical protein [Streptomyces caniscabiei]MBD9702941.1 hypothetical protein [Streptomyces caniscabiei]MBD9729270.1 hypothetical protein [Streptomyces caniscabiei]MDX3514888.1 hypothetical protein [Streptomyces caniscabiei]MDX3724141.1 hypothetical protein [Streptomyces caniscabiei]MDX3732094.1 hypothetical protein [Streptomyces caniscabiei]
MAFGAEELRVLRRALALALNPSPVSAEEVQECLRLARSVDEAAREDARLRAFLLADLARYRAALPGTVTGYAALLTQALDAGYRPHPDDLAALRALRGNPVAASLLERCRPLVAQDVRARFAGRAATSAVVVPASRAASGRSRLRLTALPGGLVEQDARAAGEPARPKPARPSRPAEPADKPGPVPRPDAPRPARRPIPTPGEVFPPKRKPAAPPANPPQQLAAV